MPRVPQPVTIAACLLMGLGLGLAFPQNQVVLAIAQSGTWFLRTVVTLATAIVFILMSAALARTLQSHARGTRFLAILVTLYVVMAAVSLVYVSAWIPVLTGLPFSRADVPLPGFLDWLHGVGRAFGGILTEQPLLQVLLAAAIAGALVGSVRVLRPVAHGLLAASDWILAGFAKLLWYYPIMIGCLAIFIPARFGCAGSRSTAAPRSTSPSWRSSGPRQCCYWCAPRPGGRGRRSGSTLPRCTSPDSAPAARTTRCR